VIGRKRKKKRKSGGRIGRTVIGEFETGAWFNCVWIHYCVGGAT
jgi:hypothetical protein